MLLRHTQKEITPRSSLAVNPAKTCQPVGAMYAALGMNRCLPHSHGSQGCCAYHRSTLTRHYKEPVMAATSSFTEGSSVFGGQSNLLQSIDNIFSIYDPDVIAIHTTCLSETIGDDMVQIIAKASDDGKIPKGKTVIHTNTPSYIGSHVTGFSNMVRNMVEYFAQPEENKIRTLNIIPGWVEPADMSEIKRICGMMKIETLMFPDTSGTLAAPLYRTKKMYPDGGVTVEQLKRVGMSSATIALGAFASLPAAERLDEKAEVPYHALDLPIGLTATDKFIDTLRKVAGVEVPPEVMYERGRLVDLICDTHQYLHNKRVALWGDPDQLVALSQFLLDLDMQPVYAVTGTPGQLFERQMKTVLGDGLPEAKYVQGNCADMFLMHQWIKNESVDLLIGNTYGKYIARDEDIPLIRHGFPVLDRVGHQHFPTVGYRGAIRLIEQFLSAILDRQDRDAEEESFELVM